MATRASIAARAQVAREGTEAAMQRIAAGLGVDVPPSASGVIGKDPDMRALFATERTAAFLAIVAEKVGAEPAEAEEPEPTEAPADTTAGSDADDVAEDAQGEDGDTDPTLYEKPLSEWATMSDDDILAIDGIGPKRLSEIKAALDARK